MHFDWTISLGNIITAGTFLVFAILAWRDMDWRVKNLEIWRNEHMVDADSRDAIIAKFDHLIVKLEVTTDALDRAVRLMEQSDRRRRLRE